jgi:hypothetical protein
MHRDVNLAASQGIAYGADEHTGTADLGELALINITGGGNANETRIDAAGR